MKFKECLEEGKLVRIDFGGKAAETERLEAEHDLAAAAESLAGGEYKWAIIQAYYAAFHSCKAFVFEAGYREKSHDCLVAAWEELGPKKPLVPRFKRLKALREQSDYGCSYSKEDAAEAVEIARQIIVANTGSHPPRTPLNRAELIRWQGNR